MTQRRIEVVPYSDDWSNRFNEEATRLREAFGSALVEAHHIGSTAVTNLDAKPTIDILVEVENGTDIPSFYPAMERLGYMCRGECLDAEIPGTPGRFYFVLKDGGAAHLVHVHVCTVGHPEIAEKLAFRDYLRTHSKAASEYAALKRKLARKFEFDNIGYMRGKDAFIQDTIRRTKTEDGTGT